LEIWWPTSNSRQNFTDVAVDQFLEIKEFAKDYTKLVRHPFRLGGPARDGKISSKQNTVSADQEQGQARK
jgi:hypothetical protein